jgi:hypothetical protein
MGTIGYVPSYRQQTEYFEMEGRMGRRTDGQADRQTEQTDGQLILGWAGVT